MLWRHFQRGVDTVAVVPIDGLMDLEHQLAERVGAVGIAEINLELRAERLLVSVLPRARLLAVGDCGTEERQGLDEAFGRVLSSIV